MLDENLAFLTHASVGAKHQGSESTMLYVKYTLQVLSLLLHLVGSEDCSSCFSSLARGVHMRNSNVEECCLTPLPETACFDIET